MEDGAPVFDATQEIDLMDELLSGRCWLETADCSELLELGTPNSWSPLISSGFSPVFDIGDQDDVERLGFPSNQSSNEIQVEDLNSGIPKYPNPSSEAGASWWIQPGGPAVSMKERLRHALSYIKESQQYGDVLVQTWMPVKRGEKQVLTTYGQPFSLNHNCQSLANYRTISMGYQFSAEEGSSEAQGLPGRVFLGRVPEWTPDAQYFSSDEYPRVSDARRCDVRGTIAIPIFERDSRSCIGVVELVMTAQKVNYSSDIENMCNALQAVNLRSSDVLSILPIKVSNNTYEAALPEIREVLRTACNLHRLPLAQTWISCIQQGKRGSRHSDENYEQCISTFDDACFVNDPYMLSFHEACSEHHLLRGEGVVGKAFTTNQPCFSSDITSFSKIEYPLSHHAKLFHLRAAVAIRLRSIHTDNADFVLEFFLPVDCKGDEEQKLVLSSLSTTIRQVCQSLRIVTDKELEDEAPPKAPKLILSKGKSVYKEGSSFLSAESPSYVPLEYNDQGIERFTASAHCEGPQVVGPAGKLFTEFQQHQQDSVPDTIDHKDSFPGDGRIVNATKAAEKRQTKSEKTVSMQVLRQYFAGSLKDAAKSVGVCPTTLKRICRQHGITRWPSRKIKKVDHSLRKLQVVIDSVQGAQGPFQLSSLYQNLTKAPGPEKDLPTLNQKDDPECSIARQQGMTSASNSLSSSSCSQSSSSGGTKRSSEAPPELEVKQEAPLEEENQNQSQYGNMLKVKASFGGERIRFRLQPNWGFRTLKQEIVRRFSIHDIESVCIKYLDDDAEWVLLTCDADLEECVDIYKSSDAYTIKISVHHL